MSRHELDRPAWTALTTRHAGFAEGGGCARRYPPAIVPFAATPDDEPESLAALERLIRPGETAILLQAEPVRLPAGLETVSQVGGVQMLATVPMPLIEDARIEPLGADDAADMLELATLTRPGPFTPRARDIGRFWGIREGGRLAAMAGQRLAQSGHVELSGVCTHPEAQGRGFGRLLSRFVTGQIAAAGDLPYLHTYATNATAIRLYETIGFALRTPMNVAVVRRPD